VSRHADSYDKAQFDVTVTIVFQQ